MKIDIPLGETVMKILYFDLTAIIILVILLSSLFFRKMLSGRANKYLVLLFINILLAAIFDIWSEAYGIWLPIKESNTNFRKLLCYAYFLSRNFNTLLYQLFLCAITDTWHILMKNK